ncbi:restriction endonuclease subunit S [Streptococcus parasuis]|uniref:Restriction endonuclease subunit S n=1 Tax=Streptococcus parasuis TaxID=1501662 RepID=A0A4Q8L2X8_9STRE|nr:restriction endonuclease subunit S [Streptococcus parasuis]TAA14457.1 restriction endonuclease subunit S [Streptococcus parasuis]
MSEKFIIANNYCREVFDGTHDTPKPSDHGYKLVTSKNIIGNKLDLNSAYLISQEDYLAINKRSKVSQFDVLFSMIGSVGNVYIEQRKNEEIDYSIKNIGVFSSKTEKEAYWLYYYLQSPYAQSFIKKFLNGAVQKFLPLQTLRAFPILSPVENYENIISILKNIDQKIALNNQINEELEAMAKTLYDYWFVQFDFPDENGKPYKSSGGKMVYNDQLKREIPEGWGVEKIENIAQTGSGGTPKSTNVSYYSNGEIPWINSGELEQMVITSTSNFITEEGLNNSSAKLFPSGTILVAMYGATAGKVSFLTFEASTNQAICAIMLTDIRMRYYLKNVIEDLYQYLVKLSTGSARDNLSQDMIKNIKVVIPSNDILDRFYDFSNNVIKEITKKQQENEQLTQLRDWLLPMLMNGQVKVEDKT